MYLQSLTLGTQTIHLFDLGITTAERHRRRVILDSELTDYFFDNEQTSYIYHQQGQPAKLRLEPLVLQSLTQPKMVAKHDYQLAISYALPLVAVAWSDSAIAIDICEQAAFNTMTDRDINDFCQLYLPYLLDDGLPNKNELAKQWCVYEAKLKALKMPLQEFDNQLLTLFSQMHSVTQSIDVNNKCYWLTLAQFQPNTERNCLINSDMMHPFSLIT